MRHCEIMCVYRVDLKHFLQDMRSVLEYSKRICGLREVKARAVVTQDIITSAEGQLADDAVDAYISNRLGGARGHRAAARNLTTHKHLLQVTVGQLHSVTELICTELEDDRANSSRALSTRVEGTWMAVGNFLQQEQVLA